MIKQTDLRTILEQRDLIAALRRELRARESDLDARELLVMHAIDTRQPCERGPLSPGITEQPGARRPRWKEEFAAALGAAAVERVIRETPAGEATRKLVILEGGKVVQP